MGNDDLDVLVAQERMLQFSSFDADLAWQIGLALRGLAKVNGRPIGMGIWMTGRTLFRSATNGTTPDIEAWLRRKRATVERFGQSSYRVGLELQRDGSTLMLKQGLPMRTFAVHGGGFPVVLHGTGCVGAVVLSGLPQRQDHEMVVQAMADVLGVAVPRLA